MQVLDAMGAAAELMSTPPRLLGAPAIHPGLDPHVRPHQRLAAAADARVSEVGSAGRESGRMGSGEGSEVRGEALPRGKTRVWGVKSLAQRSAAPKRTFRSRWVQGSGFRAHITQNICRGSHNASDHIHDTPPCTSA